MNQHEPGRNVYIGHRYVPLLIGEWDNSIAYEGLSIVTYKGASYTSKKRVPVGIDIENDEFWVLTGNYDAQVEYYREEVGRVQEEIRDTKTDLEGQMEDTKSYVDDETDSARQYVDGEVESLTNHVNTNVDQINNRMTNQETTISDNMETLQNALYNEIDNVGTTTFIRGNQNTVVEVDTPYKALEIEYNSNGLLTEINEVGPRKSIRTTVNRAGNGEVQSYDREEN